VDQLGSERVMSEDQRRHLLNRSKTQIEEARVILEEMEHEARTAPLKFRGEMLGKVRSCREAVGKLNIQLRRTSKATVPSSFTSSSTASGGTKHNTTDELIQSQILEGTMALDRTTQSIVRSQQVAFETEAVGEEIMGDLGTQREVLERTRNRIAETDNEINKSRKILRRLYIGVYHNKILMIIIIIIEVAVLAGLVYYKFIM